MESYIYLMIFEDGTLAQAKEPTQEDYDCGDAGIVSIIRVSAAGSEVFEVYQGEGTWGPADKVPPPDVSLF